MIRNTAVLLVRLVDGEVGNHAPTYKLLGHKLPCKSDVLIKRKFVLQGNVKAVCKLGFLAALSFLHGVPEGGPVLVLGREKTCSIRTKKALSLMPRTSGTMLSTAAPRVIRRWFRFFLSPSV